MTIGLENPAELSAEYVDALRALDARRARDVVREAFANGLPAERVYLEVLAPAMYEIGDLWESGAITVGHEHLATAVTAELLSALATSLAPTAAASPGYAIVSCTEGENHAVGSQMVTDFLRAAGWRVDHLAASTPGESLAGLAAELRPDVVALSTALPENLSNARATVARLTELEPRPRIVVGGLAYDGVTDPAGSVGADAHAGTPAELLEVVLGE